MDLSFLGEIVFETKWPTPLLSNSHSAIDWGTSDQCLS